MKKILKIEDDHDILELTQLVFNDAGFEAVTRDTKPSIDEIININPDLVIIDHFLKGELGSDICKELKANPLMAGIPCVMFSATQNIKDISAEVCADDYILKPFDIDDLVKKISSLV